MLEETSSVQSLSDQSDISEIVMLTECTIMAQKACFTVGYIHQKAVEKVTEKGNYGESNLGLSYHNPYKCSYNRQSGRKQY